MSERRKIVITGTAARRKVVISPPEGTGRQLDRTETDAGGRGRNLGERPAELQAAAELASADNRYADEARIWARLGRTREAAEAYERAARKAEKDTPDDAGQIADIYEQAARFFGESDLQMEERNCRVHASRLRQQPIVEIGGQTAREFKENEWNTLALTIQNSGYGVAYQVRWTVVGNWFETAASADEWLLTHVGIGKTAETRLHIKPKSGQRGQEVPFVLEWFWKNRVGEQYFARVGMSVIVRREGDSSSEGPRISIGTVIQNIDDSEHDFVKIERSAAAAAPSQAELVDANRTPEDDPLTCPNCHSSVPLDAKYCGACGRSISSGSN